MPAGASTEPSCDAFVTSVKPLVYKTSVVVVYQGQAVCPGAVLGTGYITGQASRAENSTCRGVNSCIVNPVATMTGTPGQYKCVYATITADSLNGTAIPAQSNPFPYCHTF